MRTWNTGKFEAQPDLVLLKKELQILCRSTTELGSQKDVNGTTKVLINTGSAIEFLIFIVCKQYAKSIP
jgi:hypothetical protein